MSSGIFKDANCWAVIMNERLRRTIGNIDRMPREDRRRHVQLIIRGILQVPNVTAKFCTKIGCHRNAFIVLSRLQPNREQLAGTALAQLAAAILWNEWRVHG